MTHSVALNLAGAGGDVQTGHEAKISLNELLMECFCLSLSHTHTHTHTLLHLSSSFLTSEQRQEAACLQAALVPASVSLFLRLRWRSGSTCQSAFIQTFWEKEEEKHHLSQKRSANAAQRSPRPRRRVPPVSHSLRGFWAVLWCGAAM